MRQLATKLCGRIQTGADLLRNWALFVQILVDDDEEQDSEFTLEYPRNPQIPLRDYSVPADLYAADEGETKSSIAHHASAITFRTGLRGRKRDQPYDLSNVEYDPDRPLDAPLRGISNLSILEDSPVCL